VPVSIAAGEESRCKPLVRRNPSDARGESLPGPLEAGRHNGAATVNADAVRLLSKDPAQRAASAREVIEAPIAIERDPPPVLSTFAAEKTVGSVGQNATPASFSGGSQSRADLRSAAKQ
jgi:hypothetical protein